MQMRHDRQEHQQQERSVHEPGDGACLPTGADLGEQSGIDEGECPAAGQVGQESEQMGAIAIGRKAGAQDQREAEPRQARSLAAVKDDRHDHRGGESPQQQDREVR